jgi:type I restriction enzyme S subunit
MAKTNEAGATPRLRFPEFRDAAAWANRPLGAILDYERPEKFIVSDTQYQAHGTPVLTANKSFILGYTAEEAGVYTETPVIIFDDFTTDRKYVDFPFKLKSSAIKILRSKSAHSLKLIYELMGSIRFEPKEHKRYYISEYQRLSIALPEIDEQQKIADCLTTLDDVIAAQARKVEALRAQKRGLMQQLFPRAGETVPRLRFPEFRDGPAWDRGTLNQLLRERKRRNRELRYGHADVLSVSGDFGCVNQIELLGRSYAGASVKDYHVVETGDLVYTKSPLKRSPYGIIKANKGRAGIVSTLYAVYQTTDRGNAIYLDHYFSRDYHLNHYLQPIVKKGAKNDMKVNNAAVLSGEITVPNMEEQARIAEFLTSLDNVIAAEARKETALVAHKAGLLQQLLPSPNAD